MSVEAAAGAAAEEGPPAERLGRHDTVFLVRVEDAGLNASAPPQQRWMDGWLVRFNPGKAQRARCINAVAAGCRRIDEKLAECATLYRSHGLPMTVRITPFTQPAELDGVLRQAGFGYHDDTRVMVLPRIDRVALDTGPVPAGLTWAEVSAADYAEAVGALRGSSTPVRQAHAERLLASPVPYRGFVLTHGKEVVACGQVAQEGALVGLYDIATATGQQRQGRGEWVCKRLLAFAFDEAGARSAYLQVGAYNAGARRLYTRLGFEDGYGYHYRLAPGG